MHTKESFVTLYPCGHVCCAFLLFLLAACTAQAAPLPPTSSPTHAFSTQIPTPTPTRAPTQTLAPTATITAALNATLIPTPAPFPWLHAVSLNYLAPSDAEAKALAKRLGYLGEGASPSNMCGPLAGAILRDGGIIDLGTKLYDFWLLNPRDQGDLLAQIFPAEKFTKEEVRVPLADYDFARHPLAVGDFLYLYAGPNGNFEHMLTVSYVDEAGRAYSVTNINTDAGYVVDEFMLYDPNAPGEGLFYRWNDPAYAHLGLTGSGGFDRWHPLW